MAVAISEADQSIVECPDLDLLTITRSIGNGHSMYDRFMFVCRGLPNFCIHESCFEMADSTLHDIYNDLKRSNCLDDREALLFVYQVLNMIGYSPKPKLYDTRCHHDYNARHKYINVNLRVTALELVDSLSEEQKVVLKEYLEGLREDVLLKRDMITNPNVSPLLAELDAIFNLGVVTEPVHLHSLRDKCFSSSRGQDIQLQSAAVEQKKVRRNGLYKCFCFFSFFISIIFIASLCISIYLLSKRPLLHLSYSDQFNITDNSMTIVDTDGYQVVSIRKVKVMLPSNNKAVDVISVYKWTGAYSNLISDTTKTEKLSPHVVGPYLFTGFFKQHPLNYNGGDNPIYGVTGTQLQFLLMVGSSLTTSRCLKIHVFRSQFFYNEAMDVANSTIVSGIVDHSPCLPVGTPDSPVNVTWSYTFNETGYVYVSIDGGAEVIEGYITGTAKVFDILKLTPVCDVSTSGEHCTVNICGALCSKTDKDSYTFVFLKSNGVSNIKLTVTKLALSLSSVLVCTGTVLLVMLIIIIVFISLFPRVRWVKCKSDPCCLCTCLRLFTVTNKSRHARQLSTSNEHYDLGFPDVEEQLLQHHEDPYSTTNTMFRNYCEDPTDEMLMAVDTPTSSTPQNTEPQQSCQTETISSLQERTESQQNASCVEDKLPEQLELSATIKTSAQRFFGTKDIKQSTSLSKDSTASAAEELSTELRALKRSRITKKPIGIQYKSIPFSKEGLFHHSHDYGITIIIPPGAVQGPATLQFGTTLLLKDFKCDDPCLHPVSPFVWFHTDQVLCKPAELYIPHDVICNENEIYLFTRADEESTFELNETILISISTNIIRLMSTHFCSLCIMANPVLKKRYHLVCAKKVLDDGTIYCDICVLYSFKCLKTFKSAREGFEITQIAIPFAFEEITLASKLSDDSGWQLTIRGIEITSIKESHVDFYNFLNTTPRTVCEEDIEALKYYEEEGSYPPCFKLLFSPHPTIQRPKFCQAKLSLISKQETVFTISIELKGDETSSSPLSISPVDSAYNSCKASDLEFFKSNSGKIKDTEQGKVLVNMISFLESRLVNDWMKFGYCGLGLSMTLLREIEEGVGHDFKCCIRNMIFRWSETSQDVSIKAIKEALQASGYHLLSAIAADRFENTPFCSLCETTHGTDFETSLSHILNCSINSAQEPSLNELSNLVVAYMPAKWDLFGVQVDVPQYIIDAIRKDNPGDCRMCFIHLLEEWRKNRIKPYTWATAIRVLYSPIINEYSVAERVYDFCVHHYPKC